MDSKTLKQLIEKVLKADERLWNEDKTEFNQTLLLDLVERIDENIIGLLLQEKELKEKFFVKIKDAYVFKTNDFRFFMEEHKIDNSYTAYKNRIGLTDGKRFLKDTNDVVLNWPFKDCVLEGGQSTEEGQDAYFEYDETVTATDAKKGHKAGKYNQKTAKRKEIFFNSVLAHDEIDRLLDPKALVSWKRFAKEGEREVEEIRRDADGTIKENLIIKGNNLLALHSLKKQFAGKVKLIYIDPPYNTGGNADTFVYNNNFKRSTWLTFMKNRFEVAKELLSEEGAVIVAIGENEQAYLGILINETFIGYESHCITVIHNPGGNQGANFSYSHEYAYFIFPKNKKIIGFENRENTPDIRPLRDVSKGDHLRTDAKNCFYPIYVKGYKITGFGNVCHEDFHPESANVVNAEGILEVYPIDPQGQERKWVFARQSVEKIKEELEVKFNKNRGIYDVIRRKTKFNYKTVWVNKKYDANEHGAKLLKKLVPNNKFGYPKSFYTVYDCVNSITHSDKNAIVIDYHAGSGTTAHAVLELNKQDDGDRKFIMVEQMDYINTVTCPRVQKVMEQENIDGSFIYCELAKWNETAKEKILACESLAGLVNLFDEMYERYFLNYNLKIKEFREKVIAEKEFQALLLDEQKRIFVAMLDNNQMYVNKTEMADEKFGIGEGDQKLTGEFYNS